MNATFPAHLQATRRVDRPASEIHAVLHAEGPALVTSATTSAVVSLRALLERGGFVDAAAPRVETSIPPAGPATIRVIWNRNGADRWPPVTPFAFRPTSRWWRTDEERTGWPTATIDIVVEPRGRGAQLAAVSTRPPGTDLSTNRIDRHLRDRIARTAVEEFLAALAADLVRPRPTPTPRAGLEAPSTG